MEEEIEDLKREIKRIKKKNEIEVSNIKINYFGSLSIIIVYLILEKIDNIVLFGIELSDTASISISAFIILAFLWKETIIYTKYLSKLIIFKTKG